ncbi:putative DNA methylase [Sinorhizobium phage HMSP1-Susan]|nr:putative DNA methylase [Sinorhizobium phage HMSP1-Susan]
MIDVFTPHFHDGEFWQGDCLKLMQRVPDGYVDMILADLPYGTTQNKWDSVIPFEPLWREYWRVLKRNGAVVLTADQPFTSVLIMSQFKQFRYSWHWHKIQATGFLNAKKMPLKAVEDICVFYRDLPIYNPVMREGEARKRTIALSKTSNYGKYVKTGEDSGMERYPTTHLEISKGFSPNARPIHPTQKPVALFEYLIKTYTNPGEIVLDNTAGSGTTAVAARNTGRRWICIEKDHGYYSAAINRVRAA